jgi:hypothetical protein
MTAVQMPPADEQLEFLTLVKSGAGPLTAAYALNWTPAKLKKLMSDPSFKEAYHHTLEMQVEGIEEVAYRLASRGNTRMIELILFNRAPERWSPPTQRVKVESTKKVEVEIRDTAVDAARELIKDRLAITAIQRGAIEATASDD